MDKEVYWVEVEYVSRTGDTKPGVVYAFVPASDAIEAYQAVNEALSHRELRATNWLLIEPYQDKLFLWDDDEQEAHYERLCELAMANDECVFDHFYDQDEFERPEEEEIYWAFVEFRYLYEIEPPAQGGFANILVKAWDAPDAYRKVQKAVLTEGLEPFHWLRFTPVSRDQDWEKEDVAERFQHLWDCAESSGACQWGVVYNYETYVDE
ncbi:MAG: hypothetical protein II040_05285 [Muribaculaceae bacterium]|nr:hypothetical protein [Muribaculaceae bacterium]